MQNRCGINLSIYIYYDVEYGARLRHRAQKLKELVFLDFFRSVLKN